MFYIQNDDLPFKSLNYVRAVPVGLKTISPDISRTLSHTL